MSIPGFTAEAVINNTTTCYRLTPRDAGNGSVQRKGFSLTPPATSSIVMPPLGALWFATKSTISQVIGQNQGAIVVPCSAKTLALRVDCVCPA